MEALELLKKDHDKVKKLFEQIEAGATPAKAETLFKQIYHEMTVHSIIEEQVFYPTLDKYKELEPLMKDAYTEHAEAKRNMGVIANLESSSAEWQKKVKELQEAILHHIKDEEEKLFPKVQQLLDAKVLKQLGAELKEAKTANLNEGLLSTPMTAEQFNQPQQ